MSHRALLPLLLLALCGAKRQAPVTWWEARLPSTMHPLWAASTADLRAQAPVYDLLVQPSGDGWASPLSARPPTVADGRVTLELRKDVRWHDGERLGPADVCATVAALRSRERRTPLGARLGPRLQHCSAVPSSPSTVLIHLADTGEEDPLSALAFPVLPAHLGDLTAPDHPIAAGPVGTGPWRARSGEDVWIYTPFSSAHHPGERPVLRLFPTPTDATERAAALGDQRVDGWPVLPADQVGPLRQLDGWSLHPYPLETVLTVALDASEPPLSDPDLRRALHAAIDRGALCTKLVGTWPDADPPPCRPTASPFPSSSRATNHGVRLPEPTALPPSPSHALDVAIPAELELDPEQVGAALEAAWAPHEITLHVLPLAELFALDPGERRTRYAAVVSARTPAIDDLRPELALSGGLNWFALAAPEVQAALVAGTDEDRFALHAVLDDSHLLLPLVELSAISAWRTALDPVWMTPVDGLGAIERWGISAGPPGPRPGPPARPRRR